MDPYIGKMLDNRYEILERIGTGGMAVVYKAKCHRLNRLVAIKILKSDLAQDEDFRRRFNTESQAVAQLSYSNIVSVYDVSRGGDTEYIVMELVDGITLKQYMEKRGQLNWREALHFITQIMRGLSHAHSKGIVHRDIKPQNIMVLRDGSVKVTDFGIACLENSNQTLTQEALGSVHYISPEQARGDHTDARSDIYSAGVVLYEMLTNRLPFEGDSAVSVAIQHLSAIPLAPREINQDIPEQLELICMKAMAPELDKRYASAGEMIADLESFRKNPGISLDFELADVRPEVEDEPTRPLRTATGTNYTSSHTSSQGWERRRNYEDDYEPPRRRSGTTMVLTAVAIILAIALVVVLFRSILNSFENAEIEQYRVPSLLGMTVDAARNDMQIKDIFNIVEAGSEPSDKYGEGEILRQDPEEGEYRKGDNLVIQVHVSSGKDTGLMIDVINRSKSDAKVALDDLMRRYHLKLNFEERNSDQVTEGFVISTDPMEGGTLNKGDTINLVISKGPATMPVPPFVGIQLDIVLSQLELMEFQKGDVDEVFDDKWEAGVVVEQTPSAHTQAPVGTKINFKVSKGPEIVAPPHNELDVEMITIPLPTDGREYVRLRVTQNGVDILNKVVNCREEKCMLEIKGSGICTIEYYYDDELINSFPVTLDAYE